MSSARWFEGSGDEDMAYKSVMSSLTGTRPVARLLMIGALLIAAIVATLTYHPLFAQSQDGTIDTFTLVEHHRRRDSAVLGNPVTGSQRLPGQLCSQ